MTEDAIRPYRSADAPRLLAIWRAASEIAHPFFSAGQLDEHERLVAQVYLPKAEIWVATRGETAIGFIGLIDTFVGGLFVDPPHQGTGVGRTLVEHALERKTHLELEVYARNPDALAFYRHLGFTEIGRRASDDNGLPFELVKLRREA